MTFEQTMLQAQLDELEKIAYVFGEHRPDDVLMSSLPYKKKLKHYKRYAKTKSKERATGIGKSTLVGAGSGAAIGGLLTAPVLGVGALPGAAVGGLLGLILGANDKKQVKRTRKAVKSGKYDRALSKAIVRSERGDRDSRDILLLANLLK